MATIPSVGRIVHYVGLDGRCYAAIVSDDQDPGALIITTFMPIGPNVVAGVGYDEDQGAGSWHWPERV
jgi:hypothetical protein